MQICKNMKNFMMCQFVHHETFVCHEPSELESSTSLPGGNLVDGLPPVVSDRLVELSFGARRVILRGWCFLALLVILRSCIFWDFFVISEKFRLRILMKPRAFYIIRFEEFENHSGTPRKNREQCWIEVIFVHHETFFVKKWKFWKKDAIFKIVSIVILRWKYWSKLN